MKARQRIHLADATERVPQPDSEFSSRAMAALLWLPLSFLAGADMRNLRGLIVGTDVQSFFRTQFAKAIKSRKRGLQDLRNRRQSGKSTGRLH